MCVLLVSDELEIRFICVLLVSDCVRNCVVHMCIYRFVSERVCMCVCLCA